MTLADEFQKDNKVVEVELPKGATATIIVTLFDDGSVHVIGNNDDRVTQTMLACAADMYGVGTSQDGELITVYNAFGTKAIDE